jgi:hypothetical protein
MTGSWQPSRRLNELRDRLRAEQPRPRHRWSDLAHTCALVAEADPRPARARLADLAARQTPWRYQTR